MEKILLFTMSSNYETIIDGRDGNLWPRRILIRGLNS